MVGERNGGGEGRERAGRGEGTRETRRFATVLSKKLRTFDATGKGRKLMWWLPLISASNSELSQLASVDSESSKKTLCIESHHLNLARLTFFGTPASSGSCRTFATAAF